METYGCRVFIFYPNLRQKISIGNSNVKTKWELLEDHVFSTNIRFYKIGLYHEDIETDRDGENRLTTLSSLYEEFKHLHGEVTIDYLKIDIEGNEWKVNHDNEIFQSVFKSDRFLGDTSDIGFGYARQSSAANNQS